MIYREEIATEVGRIVGEVAGTRRGSMFGYPAFFAGRKLFACVYGDGVAIRLTPSDAYSAHARVRAFEPRGRSMRGWVLLEYSSAHAIEADRALFIRAAEELTC